jgi:hypothetical protein
LPSSLALTASIGKQDACSSDAKKLTDDAHFWRSEQLEANVALDKTVRRGQHHLQDEAEEEGRHPMECAIHRVQQTVPAVA